MRMRYQIAKYLSAVRTRLAEGKTRSFSAVSLVVIELVIKLRRNRARHSSPTHTVIGRKNVGVQSCGLRSDTAVERKETGVGREGQDPEIAMIFRVAQAQNERARESRSGNTGIAVGHVRRAADSLFVISFLFHRHRLSLSSLIPESILVTCV